jgi:hypothetical protein
MEALLSGERQLSGRADLDGLYVDAPGFAQVYRALMQQAGPRSSPPHDARPLVSVIVAPTSDGGEAARSVRSVLRSTYENLEVLAADAAPADREDDRVRPIGAGGPLPHAACNAGLQEANGEFVCCLPAGCAISESYIERAVLALQRRPELAYVSCVMSATDGQVQVVPYGLDPALVTVEDGTGLTAAVLRREILDEHGLGYRADMFPMHQWELGWAMAERGLTGEVLPEVHLHAPPQRERSLSREDQYHLCQRMAELHPELVRQHPSEILKAQMASRAADRQETLKQSFLLERFRGLALLKLALKKCLQEGPRALLLHLLAKARGGLRGRQ